MIKQVYNGHQYYESIKCTHILRYLSISLYIGLRIRSYLHINNESMVNSHNELSGKKRHLACKTPHILGNPHLYFVLTQPFFSFSDLSPYVRSKTNVGRWGCLARSSYGDVPFVAAGSCNHLLDAMHDELCAFLKAIELLNTMVWGVSFSRQVVCA
jgi:hypothetical protein